MVMRRAALQHRNSRRPATGKNSSFPEICSCSKVEGTGDVFIKSEMVNNLRITTNGTRFAYKHRDGATHALQVLHGE
jgi:hypothetical protein